MSRRPASTAWLTATVADAQDRVAEARFETPTPGYATVDVRGGFRVSVGLEIRAGVDNVTDKDYVHHLNAKNPFTGRRIAEPGRNAYVGLSWGF